MLAVPAMANCEIEFSSDQKNLIDLSIESKLVEICIRTQGESSFPQNDAWVSFG